MKLTVKTLKGSHFQITVYANDTVIAVKKCIEDVQGKDNYPCGQQLLIHNGKVLKDESTLAENKVSEDGFLVVMLSKSKSSSSSAPASSQLAPTAAPARYPTPAADVQSFVPPAETTGSASVAPSNSQGDPFGSDEFLAGNKLERTIQQLVAMGGGSWDRGTGIPNSTEVSVPLVQTSANSVGPVCPPASGAPNSSPLNLFPQEAVSGDTGPLSLGFLRNNQQPMLQELGKQNPSLLALIQENHQEFLQLINEPMDGSEGDIFDEAEQDMPHAVSVTPEEQEAIERMEAMGFDRALVIEAFLACDRNEELAVNYLLENAGDFED